jgi:ATPase subunit of ABC transporter with duplicated ATPase domains
METSKLPSSLMYHRHHHHAVLGQLRPEREDMVNVAPRVRVRALTQDIVAQLRQEEYGAKTPLEILGAESEDAGRRHLSRFGLRGSFVSAAPVQTLSGGQAMRLALGLITYPQSPHVLILDEPTNHLDMSSIGALAQAVAAFEGSVLLISHDVHFLHSFAPDKVLWLTRHGEVKTVETVDAFLKMQHTRRDKQ